MLIAAILLIIVLAYLLAVVPKLTFDIEYADDVLTVVISNWFYKKRIEKDFSKEKPEEEIQKDIKEENKKSDKEEIGYGGKEECNSKQKGNKDTKKDEGNPTPSSKLKRIKEKVFNKETGFDVKEAKSAVGEIREEFSYIWNLCRRFLSKMRYKIRIPVIGIGLDYGTDDAAKTGMAYGYIWGAVGLLYPMVARYAYVVYPMVDITPDFYGKRFDLKVKSIIKVRPVHIINAALPPLFTLIIDYLKGKDKIFN